MGDEKVGPLAGLEPAICRLGSDGFIQLSYKGISPSSRVVALCRSVFPDHLIKERSAAKAKKDKAHNAGTTRIGCNLR